MVENDNKIIKNMEKAERLISEITINNLDDKTWIKQLRASLGYLRNSIKNYKKIEAEKYWKTKNCHYYVIVIIWSFILIIIKL